MNHGPFPFDAVVFDLDGTLVATDLFWPDAARAGALRAFAELGIERRMPTRAEWMNLVGYPLQEGFAALFADLEPEQRALVLDRCVEEEQRALRAGRAALLPGAAEALETLRARGVRLGIASNCGRDYLHAIVNGLDLGRWIEEPRCLDSPGVSNKAEMIQDLLWTFDTRSAVMVGDRISDRDAAWANGLPHVHLARGFAAADEVARCEAVLDGLDELLPRLEGRGRWLSGVARELGLGEVDSLAVLGPEGSGKSLLARDLARLVEAAGRRARVLTCDPWDPAPAVGGFEGLTIVEGRGIGPDLAAALDRRLTLSAPAEVLARRVAARYRGGVGGGASPSPSAPRAGRGAPRGLDLDAGNALGPVPGS